MERRRSKSRGRSEAQWKLVGHPAIGSPPTDLIDLGRRGEMIAVRRNQ